MKENEVRNMLFVIIGALSIILSISCFNMKDLTYEIDRSYGGDAYTGMQNAAAQTSKNVKEQAEIIKFGFGSILLIGGLVIAAIGVSPYIEKNNKKNKETNDNNADKFSDADAEQKQEDVQESNPEENISA